MAGDSVVDTSMYRVLVFDDEPSMREAARREIAAIADPAGIHVDEAHSPREAIGKVRSSYFDLILLDLYKEGVLAGYEIYRALNELGCSADVIFMTRFDLDPSVQVLLRAVAGGGTARPVGFIDKRSQGRELIRTEVAKRYVKFAATQLTISNLSLVSKIINKRRRSYERPEHFPLRASLSEIDAEVERLLRRLYVELPPSLARATEVSVSLEPIGQRGLNAAVIVTAIVEIAFPGVDNVHRGQKTILKIGPRSDILAEASRFSEFVRYGVELNQRVELLGVATGDSLGALVYGFAGGAYRRVLTSLDDVLITDLEASSLTLSRSVIRGLFSSRNWYAVNTGDIEVSRYFSENLRNDLRLSSSQGEEELLGLVGAFGDGFRVERVQPRGRETHFAVSAGESDTLIIPDSSVLGLGTMYGSAPACLVYGDLDAGNVVLELSGQLPAIEAAGPRLDRACLIDFRNAGPGPRTIDAVALEASVRLADAEAACRVGGRLNESGVSDAARLEAARQMAGRVNAEIQLYRTVFEGESFELSVDGWQGLAMEILVGLRDCFPDVTLQEYLATSIRYTIRQLGLELEPVARVRILSWLAAQYALLMELELAV